MTSALSSSALWALLICGLATQLSLASPRFKAQGITVRVSGLPQGKGTLYCSLYAHPKGFPDQPQYAVQTIKKTLKQPRAECYFEVSMMGSYAVAVWQDVNDNHLIDKNWFGVPQEPVGASNNALTFFGPPSFASAMFEHDQPLTEIMINLD